MALVGDTKLLLLEEPTSGMEKYSKYKIWDIIKEIKKTKCVILSTQHIGEAAVLGDKVCVLQEGKILASGSFNELKDRYGLGYNLIIEKKTKINKTLDQIDKFVKQIIP